MSFNVEMGLVFVAVGYVDLTSKRGREVVCIGLELLADSNDLVLEMDCLLIAKYRRVWYLLSLVGSSFYNWCVVHLPLCYVSDFDLKLSNLCFTG